MGRTPAQKLRKRSQGAKRKRRRKKIIDPRESPISIAGPLKITKADGRVETVPASPDFKKVGRENYFGSYYSKPRARKY